MHKTLLLLAGVAAFAASGTIAMGNAAPFNRPDDKPPLSVTDAPVEIILQREGSPMRIEVPRTLATAAGSSRGKGPESRGGALFGSEILRTIIAGSALSLSLVVGGLWLARRFSMSSAKRTAVRTASIGLAVAILGASAAAGMAWANLAPPPPKKPKLTGKVVVTERGDSIRIYVSRSQAAQFARLARGRDGAEQTGSAPLRSAPPGKGSK